MSVVHSGKKLPPPISLKSFPSILYFIRDVFWFFLCFGIKMLIALILKIIPKRKKDLKGKIVLITGAGNGLGRELSLQLSKLGCVIICVDINKNDNEDTLKQIIYDGGSGRTYCCDVSKSENVKNLAERVLDDVGRVDILISNAGIIYRNGILMGEDDEIKKVVEVNYLASLWVIRAFLPEMIKNKEGHIVLMSSSSGIHALAHGNVYSATKFALLGTTYSLLEEFRSNKTYKNIKVSCFMPYFIDSNAMYKNHWIIRFPAISKEKAASSIVEGIRKEQKIATIPGMTMGYYFSNVGRLLPNSLYHQIRDLSYADFTIPEQNHPTKL